MPNCNALVSLLRLRSWENKWVRWQGRYPLFEGSEKDINNFINKVAPSSNLTNLASKVEASSNSVDINQIPVIDPNSKKYTSPYIIDYNILNYR